LSTSSDALSCKSSHHQSSVVLVSTLHHQSRVVLVSTLGFLWVLVLGFFMFLSSVSARFSLVLEPRYRVEGKAGSACEEFEDNEAGILG